MKRLNEGATIEIRYVTKPDAERVSELCHQLGYETTVDEIESRLRSMLGNRANAVFVAEIDGGVVGWIQVEMRSVIESGEFGEITGLVVDGRFRRRGIASRLVKRAEEWSLDSGLNRIRVRTNLIRAESHPFYRSMGFVETKTQAVYQKTLKKEVARS